jgi:hypothetical protein
MVGCVKKYQIIDNIINHDWKYLFRGEDEIHGLDLLDKGEV